MEQNKEPQISDLLSKIEDLDAQQRNIQLQLMQLKLAASKLQQQQPVSTTAATVVPARTVKPSFSLEQFIGLKLLNLIGIIVLLIGVVIGVKFAIDKNLISPFVRIVLAYIAGGLLFGLSVYLREKYEAFSAILFSGAMAAFYFTTYGAFDFYSLLSQPVAFAMMVLLTVFTVYTSLKYNRQEIAVLALVGAYAIPFLVGGKSGNAVALFSYIFLINCGILFISFRKDWEWLKSLALGFSYIILLSWQMIRYETNEWFGVALGFPILLFIQFTFTICAFRLLRKKEPDTIDYLLLSFLSTFSYICTMIAFKDETETLVYARITLLAALVHGLLAWLATIVFSNSKIISRFYLTIAVLLLIIYVPIQFDGITISFVWIAGAIALFAAGLIRKIRLLRILSMVLFGVTLLKLITFDSASFSAVEKIITYISIGAVLLVISFLYQKYKGLLFEKDE
ncbi:MAG TPA: DUF2339 domain-containing protein [Lacibacter sp.]|nr:DUF2339 domain-containing protein [Lacibacter sp.]